MEFIAAINFATPLFSGLRKLSAKNGIPPNVLRHKPAATANIISHSATIEQKG